MRLTLLLLVLLTAACTSVGDEVPAGTTSGTTAGTTSDVSDATPGSTEVTLAPGETKSARGITIRFDRVIGDSRCPSDVTCAWEGDAELLFTLSAPGEKAREVRLHTTRRDTTTVTLAEHSLTLVGVAPAPHSQRQIAPGDYRATVAVGE